MRREQLEHILRAAADVTHESEFVIVGAASLLGTIPDPPPELALTFEADLYPANRPDLSDELNGNIGELSMFHDLHRIYAHGVGPTTAVLPTGWENRLVRLSGPGTNGAVGLCLEVNDLAVSKLVAGRPKDLEFVQALLRHRLLQVQAVVRRLRQVDRPSAVQEHLVQTFGRLQVEIGLAGPAR